MIRIAAALVGSMTLAACSALPAQNAAEPSPPSNYGALVANAMKTYGAFAKDHDFAISNLRWVHASTGWNWLACVRYQDGNHPGFYAVFIKDNTVVNARYDILSDRCAAQQYAPFDLPTGAIQPAEFLPAPLQQQPLAPQPLIQQPIY